MRHVTAERARSELSPILRSRPPSDRLAHLIEEPLFLLLERLGAAGIVRRRRFGELADFAEPGAIGAPGLLIDNLDAASGAGHPSAQRETVQLIAGSR